MRYLVYQNTGDRFIPTIPVEWALKSGRYCFRENSEKNSDLSQCNMLQFTYGTIVRKKDQEISPENEEIYRKYTKVTVNDIMLNGLNLNYDFVSQRVGIVRESGIITSAYLSLRCNDVYNPFYANYVLKTFDAKKIFHGMGSGVRLTLGFVEFSRMALPVPTRDEQDQIVRYLDWQVSKINKLIHGYQRQIKLLQEKAQKLTCSAVLHGIDETVVMKSSGIQNIESIPEHWRVLQNKRIFAERTEFSETGKETLLSVSKHYGVKPYYALEDSEQFATIKPAESLVGYKKVRKNDVAMNIMRARNGSFGVSEYDGIVSPAYAVFHPIIECNPMYMHYLLRTPHVIGIFESYSYGIAEHRRRLYAVDFLRLYLPVPPVNEQNEIVQYVESIQEETKKISDKIQKEIELLREYRTRLISDVVTGQMDVRGIVIPEYTPENDTEDITDTENAADEEVSEDE